MGILFLPLFIDLNIAAVKVLQLPICRSFSVEEGKRGHAMEVIIIVERVRVVQATSGVVECDKIAIFG